jgi:hypothetical protein
MSLRTTMVTAVAETAVQVGLRMVAPTKNSSPREACSVIRRATRRLPPAGLERRPDDAGEDHQATDDYQGEQPQEVHGGVVEIHGFVLTAQGVALGLHLPSLALQLLREKVVERRPDHHDGPEEQHVVEGRRDRRAQDIGPELELEPQRQETPEVQPDLRVGVAPHPHDGEQVPYRGSHGPYPDYGRPDSLDHQTQLPDGRDQ